MQRNYIYSSASLTLGNLPLRNSTFVLVGGFALAWLLTALPCGDIIRYINYMSYPSYISEYL